MTTVDTPTCQHGLPCDGTTGPEQCQRCDWCPQCGQVREFNDHTCGTCGWEWGTEPKCDALPLDQTTCPDRAAHM